MGGVGVWSRRWRNYRQSQNNGTGTYGGIIMPSLKIMNRRRFVGREQQKRRSQAVAGQVECEVSLVYWTRPIIFCSHSPRYRGSGINSDFCVDVSEGRLGSEFKPDHVKATRERCLLYRQLSHWFSSSASSRYNHNRGLLQGDEMILKHHSLLNNDDQPAHSAQRSPSFCSNPFLKM